MRRRQDRDILEDRKRRRNVFVGQIVMQRRKADPPRNKRQRQQRLDLGREVQSSFVRHMVIERLFSGTIAKENPLLLLAVPDGNGKHAVQLVDKIMALFFVE